MQVSWSDSTVSVQQRWVHRLPLITQHAHGPLAPAAIGKVITFTDTENVPKAIEFTPKRGRLVVWVWAAALCSSGASFVRTSAPVPRPKLCVITGKPAKCVTFSMQLLARSTNNAHSLRFNTRVLTIITHYIEPCPRSTILCIGIAPVKDGPTQTGVFAIRYRDPLTGQPYADLRAFQILRDR